MLLGPFRAVSYILSHGLAALVLGVCMVSKTRFAVAVPAIAATRFVSQMAAVSITSLAMGQNILALVVANVGMMLDKAGLFFGFSGSAAATSQLLWGVVFASILANCAHPAWQ